MFKKILLASLLSMTSAATMAAPMLQGGFNMNDLSDGANTNVVWDSAANTVDFTYVDGGGNNFEVVNATGDFAGNSGALGTIVDFNYSSLPLANLFSFSTFTFSLTSLYEVYEGSSLSLAGYGTMSDSSGAYEDTTFGWQFSATPQGAGTWSASAVPAPATLALLGLGLIAMAVTKRGSKAA